MITRALIFVLAALAVGSPATALAATGAVSGSTLTYTAAAMNQAILTAEATGTPVSLR